MGSGRASSEFLAFDDDTFMAENEDQLNSLIRSLEKFEENRDPAVRWYGRPRDIREKDIRTFGRNTAVTVRHFWHWRRCPVAMENRVAEAHLRRLGIHPVSLSPGRDWEEEKERRMLSRSRSPQRRQAPRQRPTSQEGDGDTVSLTQKRKSAASREESQDDQRRRRTREWRGRVATELAGLRTPRARAEARRHLFYQLCRVHGPDIVPFAEGLLESVWALADAEPVGRQTVDTAATDWAARVANEVGTMWVASQGSGSALASASASSSSGGPHTGDLVPVRRTGALDPPESTPYGIFHAAWVWPNGSWSTRGEMERMGYGHLVTGEGREADAAGEELHEPDRAGGTSMEGRDSGIDGDDPWQEVGNEHENDENGDEEGTSMVQGVMRVRPSWRQLMEQLTEWQQRGFATQWGP